jgi:type II secretory pathway pseudopilin PulG
MPGTEGIQRIIGLTMIALIGTMAVIGVLLFVFYAIGGFSQGMQDGIQGQDAVTEAMNNYNYQLDLVQEQTQRLDMYYAAKTSTSMTQPEFASWLDTIQSLTDVFISRENNATVAGEVYLKYLQPDSNEYNRVIQNDNVTVSDVSKVTATYNGNVYIYNQEYGSTYGNLSYIE